MKTLLEASTPPVPGTLSNDSDAQLTGEPDQTDRSILNICEPQPQYQSSIPTPLLDTIHSTPLRPQHILNIKEQALKRHLCGTASGSPFSPTFWRSGILSEREASIAAFIDYYKEHITQYCSACQVEPDVNWHALKEYLHSMAHEAGLTLLLCETSDYFQTLLNYQSQNQNLRPAQEAVAATLTLFPPSSREDFACLEGSRSRVQAALTWFLNETYLSSATSLGDALEHHGLQVFNQYIETLLTRFNFQNHVSSSLPIHLRAMLTHLAGIPKETVEQSDHYFNLPLKELPTRLLYRILISSLTANQAFDAQPAAHTLRTQLTESLLQFNTRLIENRFDKAPFNEIKQHPFFQYARSLSPDLDLSDERFIVLDPTSYQPIAWKRDALLKACFKPIHQQLFQPHQSKHPSTPALNTLNALNKSSPIPRRYTKLFSNNTLHETMAALLLSSFETDPTPFTHTVYALFALCSNTKNASPIMALSIAFQLGLHLPKATCDTEQEPLNPYLLGLNRVSTLAKELAETQHHNYLAEKLTFIASQWTSWIAPGLDGKGPFPTFIALNQEQAAFKPKEKEALNQLVTELLKGHAPIHQWSKLTSQQHSEIDLPADAITQITTHPHSLRLIKSLIPILARSQNQGHLKQLLEQSVINGDKQKLSILLSAPSLVNIICFPTKNEKTSILYSALEEAILDNKADIILQIRTHLNKTLQKSPIDKERSDKIASQFKSSPIGSLLELAITSNYCDSITALCRYEETLFTLIPLSTFTTTDPYSGHTPATLAASCGFSRALTTLAALFSEQGLPPTHLLLENTHGRSAHIIAAEQDYDHIIGALLETGITADQLMSPTQSGHTLLITAIHQHSLNILYTLRDHTELTLDDVLGTYTRGGYRSLYCAIASHCFEFIDILFEMGASIEQLFQLDSNTHLIYEAIKHNNTDIINYLIEHNTDWSLINSCVQGKLSPLHTVCRENKIDFLDAMLTANPPIPQDAFSSRQGPQQLTCETLAHKHQSIDIINRLGLEGLLSEDFLYRMR